MFLANVFMKPKSESISVRYLDSANVQKCAVQLAMDELYIGA